jgi:hypothetical protein
LWKRRQDEQIEKNRKKLISPATDLPKHLLQEGKEEAPSMRLRFGLEE